MTNYNKRLDEVLWSAIMREPAHTKPGEEYKATWNEPVIKKAKQAITSLIKELVAEAKPKNNWLEGSDLFCGQDEGVGEFEQNLLKELEEV